MIPALSGIKLIEDNPARTLVSASTYNRLARAVKNISIEGGEIGVNALGGIHIQVVPSASSPTPSGGSAYDGPFAVTVSNGVATVASGTIWAGITQISYGGSGGITLIDGYCIAISVTYANSAYRAYTDALPYGMIGQQSGIYTQILGQYLNGIWSQWWNAGDIQVCGRVV